MIRHPIIGNWYKCPDMMAIFEVVALDEQNIEIQYFDGEIEEVQLEDWLSLSIQEIAAPEDWSGAFELAKEDLVEYTDDVIRPEKWDNPLTTIEPPKDK